MTSEFVLPPYPYEALDEVRTMAEELPGGAVDLSVGVPCDPVPDTVVTALNDPDSARPYPPSVGSGRLLAAVVGWASRQLAVDLPPAGVGVCIGSKEFVAGLPHVLRLKHPERDTVLYPSVSYPSYAMGADLAGCRAVPVPVDSQWRIDLTAIRENDASRALCLWVNSPSNPSGALDDLGEAAQWGRAHGVLVASDECYQDFTWVGPPRSVLQHGTQGVLAVHSLSKRSNLAGLRVGFYAGDPEMVSYLREVRKHQGFMVPGPAQVAGSAALGDQVHVEVQRERYHRRLRALVEVFASLGIFASVPDGGFYLWVAAPDGDDWALVRNLAGEVGLVVCPGRFFGEQGAGYVRVAAVATDDRIDLLRERAGC